MMTVHNYFGPFAMRAKLFVFAALLGSSVCVYAEPVGQDLEMEAIIESAINSWTVTIFPGVEPMDEQVFTEISPLIDSPDSIRLPADQQLAD